jgi:hypothetical protein
MKSNNYSRRRLFNDDEEVLRANGRKLAGIRQRNEKRNANQSEKK